MYKLSKNNIKGIAIFLIIVVSSIIVFTIYFNKDKIKDKLKNMGKNNDNDNDVEDYASSKDCVVGDWGNWNTCKVVNGKNKRYRYRDIKTESVGNGKVCTNTSQSQVCNDDGTYEPSENLDCVVGDWGEWTKCENGKTTKSRIRPIVTNSKNGGKKCPALQQVKNCINEDCVESPWSSWGPCINSGLNSIKTRSRSILKEPKGTGRACGEVRDTQVCENTDSNNQDCRMKRWEDIEWSTCNPITKQSTKETYIVRNKKGNGKHCPPENEWIMTKPCCIKESGELEITNNLNEGCVGDVDCEYEWGEWGNCSNDNMSRRMVTKAGTGIGSGTKCKTKGQIQADFDMQENRRCNVAEGYVNNSGLNPLTGGSNRYICTGTGPVEKNQSLLRGDNPNDYNYDIGSVKDPLLNKAMSLCNNDPECGGFGRFNVRGKTWTGKEGRSFTTLDVYQLYKGNKDNMCTNKLNYVKYEGQDIGSFQNFIKTKQSV